MHQSSDPSPDGELLTLLAVDVDRYFKRLLEAHESRLRAMIRQRAQTSGKIGEVDDILQEVFIDVYEGLKRHENDPQWCHSLKLSAWLNRVAVNAFLKYIRDHSRNAQTEPMDTLYDSPVFQFVDKTFEQPDVAFERTESAKELGVCVEMLEEPYQTAVILHCLHGYSYIEIAEKHQCPVGTVKAHVSRGKKTLRMYLESKLGR